MGRAEGDGALLTMVVVDASAALAWLLPSQSNPVALAFLAGNDDLRVAPAVFDWEVGNVLASRVKQGRISAAGWLRTREKWRALAVATADPTAPEDVLPLALAERLSLFDASYLSLALDIGGELATRDGELIQASHRYGVRVHDLRPER